MRPGVPMAISRPFVTTSRSRTMLTPPMKDWTTTDCGEEGGSASAMRLATVLTCIAISRVGVRIMTEGLWLEEGAPLDRIVSMAMTQKTIVLPVPLFACAMRSTPSRPIGIAFSCTGDGLRNPHELAQRRRFWFCFLVCLAHQRNKIKRPRERQGEEGAEYAS